MKKIFLVTSIIVLFLTELTGLLLAQTSDSSPVTIPKEKTGKLIVYYGGEESGSEVYSVSKQEGKITFSDSSEFSVSGLSIRINLNLLMDTTFCAKSLHIKGRAPGGPYQINTEFVDGKAINHISGGLDTTYEVSVHKDAVILPNGIFYPYTFLVQKYDFEKGGTQEFFAYTAPMEINVKVEDKGKETVNFAASSVELKQFFVNIAGMVGVYVWANDAGEVYKISIPMQGMEVYKEGYEPGAAEAEVDTLTKLYSSEEVTYKSGDLKIAGTVTVPQDNVKLHPAAIIISGSGPQDRDGKTPELLFSVQYKALAHALSNSGILVLRYDDRGVGKSEGNFDKASLSDFISDVLAGISYLKTRRDVDPNRICLIGHSEGAIIAPMVATKDTTIKTIVLMAGPSKPLDQVLLEQQEYILTKQNVPEEMRKQAIDQENDFFAWVRGEKQLSTEQIQQMGKVADKKQWLLEHFRHDPIQTIKSVKCRVLILQGGKDHQVLEYHAQALNQALDDAQNKNHTLKIFPDLDHLFCKTEGEGDYAEYANTERPLDPDFLNYLTGWLKKEL